MRSRRKDEYATDSPFRGDIDELAARVDALATMVRDASGAVVAVRGEVASAKREADERLRDETAQTAKLLSRVQDDIAKLRSTPAPKQDMGKSAPPSDARITNELSVLADRVGTLSSMVNANAGHLAAREGSLEKLREEVGDESARMRSALEDVKRELAALGTRVAAAATKSAAPALDPGVAGKIEALSDRMHGLSDTVKQASGGLVAATGALSRTDQRVAEIEARLERSSTDAREAQIALERVVRGLSERLSATKSTDDISAKLSDAVRALGDRIDTVSGIVRTTAGRLAAREELAIDLEARLDSLAGRVDALATEVDDTDGKLLSTVAFVDEATFTEAYEPLRAAVETIVGRLDGLSADASTLDQDIATELHERMDGLEIDHEHLREDIAVVENEAKQRDAEITGRQSILETAQAVIAEEAQKLAAVQAALTTRADAVEATTGELTATTESIVDRQDALEQSVESVRSETQVARDEIQVARDEVKAAHAELTDKAEIVETIGDRQDALEEGQLVLSDRQAALEDKHIVLAEEIARVEATAYEALNRPAADAAPVLRDLAEKLERIDTDRRVVAEHLAAVENAWGDEREALREQIEQLTATASEATTDDEADRVVRELTVRLGRLERERESVTELASLADGWTSSLGTLAARVEYGLIKLQQASTPAEPGDAHELVELAGRVAAMERDRDTVLGEIARATETWSSERAALHERVAELAARIITGPADALAAGAAGAELGDASQELDRLRIALEGMRMRLAYHEKAVAEISGGSVASRIDDISGRLDQLQRAIHSASAGAVMSDGAFLGPDVDDLLKRLERAERAVVEQRSDMLGHLEKIAARMDWRLRRLETEESHIQV